MDPLQNQLEAFLRKRPTLGKEVYIASGAAVLGDVTLGDGCSIWYQAVLRGDINRIIVGHHTNIQDGAVLHVADDHACVVGDFVTIGHGAIVHAGRVGSEVLVGMGSIILDAAEIGEQCIIGAGALVTQGARIPPGSLAMGTPARVKRQLNAQERSEIKGGAEKYVRLAAYCLRHGINVSAPLPS